MHRGPRGVRLGGVDLPGPAERVATRRPFRPGACPGDRHRGRRLDRRWDSFDAMSPEPCLHAPQPIRHRRMRVRGAVLREMGRAAPYGESRPLEICDLELAGPGPGELLVRIRAAGLCHSDLSVIDGSRPRVMPMVLGHEASGEVVETGAGVGDFAAGDRVVLTFVPSCGHCPACLDGRAALCEPGAAANTAGELLGGGRRWGDLDGHPLHHHLGVSAFAEHVVVSARSAVRVGPDLPFEVAAVFGCAVLTGAGAALHSAEVGVGESVAVFGLGGVGLAALLGASPRAPRRRGGRHHRVEAGPRARAGRDARRARGRSGVGAGPRAHRRRRPQGDRDRRQRAGARRRLRRDPPRRHHGHRRPARSEPHAHDPARSRSSPRSARCAAHTWARACPPATCPASSISTPQAACPWTGS